MAMTRLKCDVDVRPYPICVRRGTNNQVISATASADGHRTDASRRIRAAAVESGDHCYGPTQRLRCRRVNGGYHDGRNQTGVAIRICDISSAAADQSSSERKHRNPRHTELNTRTVIWILVIDVVLPNPNSDTLYLLRRVLLSCRWISIDCRYARQSAFSRIEGISLGTLENSRQSVSGVACATGSPCAAGLSIHSLPS